MTRGNAGVLDRLADLIRETFGDDRIVVSEETTASDVEGWDSLTNVELMVAIEAEFGVRFSTAEVASLANVGELVGLILRKQGT